MGKGIKYMKDGVTLMELVVVMVILGILATLGITQYGFGREHALSKEASVNLKLIAAAEKIYRMETGGTIYYPYSGTVTNITDINLNLKLYLPPETNWDYSIRRTAAGFTASGDRQGSGTYSSCRYSITQSQDAPTVASGTCVPLN